MALVLVAWRVTVVTSVALLCLGPTLLSSARLVEGKQTLLDSRMFQDVQLEGRRSCDPGSSLDLQGSSTFFQFNCPAGATLVPAEDSGGKAAQSANLEKVYQFAPTQTRDKPECNGDTTTLQALVPGSALVKLNSVEKGSNPVQPGASGPVFNLTIGEAQKQAKHFCYVCASPTGGGQSAQAAVSNCTVYVTVPEAKEDLPPGEHSGSVSLSPSVFGWLRVSLTACALGLILHP